MKIITKRIILFVLFVIVSCIIHMTLRYVLNDDVDSYTRIMFHELYEAENIDIAFVGSSHVYRSLVPDITDKGFGAYTFNAGSSSQFMDGSLAVIKEIVKNNNVSQIYLELYYGIADKEEQEDRSELTSTYIISDYMKPSFDRINYLLRASSKEHWVNGFIIERRKWDKLFDFNYMADLIADKNSANYKEYKYDKSKKSNSYYAGRGFVATDLVVAEDEYINYSAYGDIVLPIAEKGNDWYDSLNEIIDYCNKNNVELTFFVTPEPEWTIVGKNNYQEYHDFIKNIADEKDIEFYDFNFCKSKYLDTNDRHIFRDEDHLNTDGAELFSAMFADFFMGRISYDDILYESLDEKLNDEPPILYGIAKMGNECSVISNRNGQMLYKIVVYVGGEETFVQELSDNKKFAVPDETSGKIVIQMFDEIKQEIIDEKTVNY